MANTISAYAYLDHKPPDAFLEVLCKHAAAELPHFAPQNISNTIWALATLKHYDQVSY